jgi:hypothetical protein
MHVHAKCQGRESKAELLFEEGVLTDVRLSDVRGKEPLAPSELGNLRDLVEHFGDDIARKWVDFFVFHKRVAPMRITRRIR